MKNKGPFNVLFITGGHVKGLSRMRCRVKHPRGSLYRTIQTSKLKQNLARGLKIYLIVDQTYCYIILNRYKYILNNLNT